MVYDMNSAFPLTLNAKGEIPGMIHQGLTKAAFFAAHAPAKIPDWFGHTMEHLPTPNNVMEPYNWRRQHEHSDIFKSHWDVDFDDWYPVHGMTDTPLYDKLKAEYLVHLALYEQYQIEKKAWDNLNQMERFFQWRTYYGEKMAELCIR